MRKSNSTVKDVCIIYVYRIRSVSRSIHVHCLLYAFFPLFYAFPLSTNFVVVHLSFVVCFITDIQHWVCDCFTLIYICNSSARCHTLSHFHSIYYCSHPVFRILPWNCCFFRSFSLFLYLSTASLCCLFLRMICESFCNWAECDMPCD